MSTRDGGSAYTTVEYLTLGLVAWLEPCTSYDLKREVERTVSHFWTFSHTALYQAPPQLAAAGLLLEEQEETGRRRRLYRLTPDGRAALLSWLEETYAHPIALRDLALLQLVLLGPPPPPPLPAHPRRPRRTPVLARGNLRPPHRTTRPRPPQTRPPRPARQPRPDPRPGHRASRLPRHPPREIQGTRRPLPPRTRPPHQARRPPVRHQMGGSSPGVLDRTRPRRSRQPPRRHRQHPPQRHRIHVMVTLAT